MARILVIDDNESIRNACAAMLEMSGHTVATASNGRDGIRLFGETPADVVLCDIYMPEKDGLETIRELTRDYPGVRIIAMTGATARGQMNFLASATRFGAVGALEKPFDVDTLVGAVRGALAHS